MARLAVHTDRSTRLGFKLSSQRSSEGQLSHKRTEAEVRPGGPVVPGGWRDVYCYSGPLRGGYLSVAERDEIALSRSRGAGCGGSHASWAFTLDDLGGAAGQRCDPERSARGSREYRVVAR